MCIRKTMLLIPSSWLEILLVLIHLLSTHPPATDAARILALLTTPSRSHHIFNRALTLALAEKGHQVTVFSPDPEKKPVNNLRDIVVENGYDGLHDAFDYEGLAKVDHFNMVNIAFEWGATSCDQTLRSKGARQLLSISANETFDLIINEVVFQECVYGFISKFGNPPVIGITAFIHSPWIHDVVGNPANPSYVNTYLLPYTDHMDFFQRITNSFLDLYTRLYRQYVYLPRQDRVARKFFGESIPTANDVEDNIGLMLVNSHFSFDYPQPLVPADIPVGGMHVKPGKPLPKDLKSYFDSCSQGVIYMSLGSNIRSSSLPEPSRRALLEAFSQLPYCVLWKWETDHLPGKPDNVKIIKWAPQNDLLAHPNLKLFISHGGMMSTTEAIYHGVPLIGMPFFADQYLNMYKNVIRGTAVHLDVLTLTKESILEAVNKVLKNSSYSERMRQMSLLFRDRPQTALETAVFWTEYALRHRDLKHLRCASLDLAWYQRLLLDVIAALLAAAVAVIAVIFYTTRYVYRRLTAASVSSKKKKVN